jgi:hypothetical protein
MNLRPRRFNCLAPKLAPGGGMVVQFIEEVGSDAAADAELRVYEPSVSWNTRQILKLARSAGLQLEEIRTKLVNNNALWHWTHISRPTP